MNKRTFLTTLKEKHPPTNVSNFISTYKMTNKNPIVIEISGTPNSGKTTAINTLRRVLIDYKISFDIIFEKANNCRIKDKLSADFNIWTACNTISSLIEKINKSYDVIICERGVFDALCWCYFHKDRNSISHSEFNKMIDFYSMNKFIDITSFLVIFKCSEEASIEREKSLLQGTIINEDTIKQINFSIEQAQQEFSCKFNNVAEIDTTALSQDEIDAKFVNCIFEKIITENVLSI